MSAMVSNPSTSFPCFISSSSAKAGGGNNTANVGNIDGPTDSNNELDFDLLAEYLLDDVGVPLFSNTSMDFSCDIENDTNRYVLLSRTWVTTNKPQETTLKHVIDSILVSLFF